MEYWGQICSKSAEVMEIYYHCQYNFSQLQERNENWWKRNYSNTTKNDGRKKQRNGKENYYKNLGYTGHPKG